MEETRPVTLWKWAILLEVENRQHRIEGVTVWCPSPRYAAYVRAHSDDLPVSSLALAAGSFSVLVVAVVIRLARRRLLAARADDR